MTTVTYEKTHVHVFSNCAKQIRIFTNTFTLTPYNGAEALVFPFENYYNHLNICTVKAL